MPLSVLGRPVWAVLLAFAAPLQGAATATPPPSISALLQHLRSSIGVTVANMPDISCSESLRSTQRHNGHVLRSVTEESILQVRRKSESREGNFSEMRRVISQDGKSASNRSLRKLPLVMSNGLGTTFATYLGAAFQNCNRYTLLPSGPGDGNVLLQATHIEPSPSDPHCSGLVPGTVGEFWIDGRTFQIRRFGVSKPHAAIFHGHTYSLNMVTEYHLVRLGPKQFLLPARIDAKAVTPGGKDQLGYEANYRKCHLYSSTVKLLNNSQTSPAQ